MKVYIFIIICIHIYLFSHSFVRCIIIIVCIYGKLSQSI